MPVAERHPAQAVVPVLRDARDVIAPVDVDRLWPVDYVLQQLVAHELLAAVYQGLRPGVVATQLEPFAEAAVEGRLQNVVVGFAVQSISLDGAPVDAVRKRADQVSGIKDRRSAVGAGG